MPSSGSSQVGVSRTASDVPLVVVQALENVPVDANLILPFFYKCLQLDRAGQSPPGHLWIAIYSRSGRVALVLSCTDSYMGPKPIFIVNTNPIDDSDLTTHTNLLAVTLQRHVPIERVYSVFAPIRIAQLFSKTWTRETGVKAEAQPYYDAKISCLRRHEQSVTPEDSTFEIGPASQADILPIAKLGHAFASDCAPFTLTEEAALAEAQKLVSRRQVWTLKVKGRVLCIAAFTRNTTRVAAITKVYTDANCRGLGYAEHLVRRLCKYLLQDKGREAVVLFVGCENPAARVYHRVGFQGLDTIVNCFIDNVDRWLEVGFDRKKVTLGHW